MIKFENTEVFGWGHAIRGMRNPMNSWERSDSVKCYANGNCPGICRNNMSGICIGTNDIDLMKRLRNAGTDHRKFMRMITVYVDITAPLYWWKEFDTYKVGTVANSCSTMHKIAEKEFTLNDFSCEHLNENSIETLEYVIENLNHWRDIYINGGMDDDYYGTARIYSAKDKDAWWQMIQLLPSSYNQKRTVMMNYEVLANIYKSRKEHNLDEWSEHSIPEEHKNDTPNFASGKWGFCDWIKTLPYSELITGEDE